MHTNKQVNRVARARCRRRRARRRPRRRHHRCRRHASASSSYRETARTRVPTRTIATSTTTRMEIGCSARGRTTNAGPVVSSAAPKIARPRTATAHQSARWRCTTCLTKAFISAVYKVTAVRQPQREIARATSTRGMDSTRNAFGRNTIQGRVLLVAGRVASTVTSRTLERIPANVWRSARSSCPL